MTQPPVRVGLFGIGLDTYWSQFAGLKERLLGYQARIAQQLSTSGATVVDCGLVDTPDAARSTGDNLAAADVDVVFLYISTYALSSTVLPAVQRAGKPVVVLNLQPTAALDYAAFNQLGDRGAMTGDWLANCQACSVPEIACVCRRAGIPFRLVTGWLEDPQAWREIRDWLTAAGVRRGLRDLRLGALGRYYEGMLDVYTDLTAMSAVFGTHHVMIEMDEVVAARRDLVPAAMTAMHARFSATFAIDPACSQSECDRAARTAAALHHVVERHRLGALAYYYEGQPGDAGQDIITSIIPGATLLTAHHIPVAGEYEIRNAHAMKILDLAGVGGSFSELYLMDFTADVVLLGHDGPGHTAISQEQVRLVPLPLYHGKPGHGLSIQMRVQHGPATLLSVVQGANGMLSLLIAEAEAVPGSTLDIGNTNTRYRFAGGARAFLEGWAAAGPAHHCAIGVGHHAAWIAKLADLLAIPCVCVG